MTKNNVTKFPVKTSERRRNRLGARAVPCQVSDRWLQFPEDAGMLGDDKWMFVDVMTRASDGETHHKLTTLCLSKKELLKAIERVK